MKNNKYIWYTIIRLVALVAIFGVWDYTDVKVLDVRTLILFVALVILGVASQLHGYAEGLSTFIDKFAKTFDIREARDLVFSHNEIVAIWENTNDHGSELLWRGMGWKIPEEYLDCGDWRIFGAIPEKIDEADTINILIKR